jgi:hypothetical protein
MNNNILNTTSIMKNEKMAKVTHVEEEGGEEEEEKVVSELRRGVRGKQLCKQRGFEIGSFAFCVCILTCENFTPLCSSVIWYGTMAYK